MTSLLEGLNEKQKEAVVSTNGPILILAGAGSGKTKTLTHRIAYLIREKGVRAENILAVTFTNKAAEEMRQRVVSLLGIPVVSPRSYSGWMQSGVPLVGTFHSVCVKILRREINAIGYDVAFSIMDAADQKSLIRDIVKEMNLDASQFKPPAFLALISKAKNDGMSVSMFRESAQGYFEEKTAEVYARYQDRLQQNNALDFDDLLLFVVRLFREFPLILEKYQRLFQYILVDEYQDTNHAQYEILHLLAEKQRNICAVGDDWQSIYRFRGADIRNILDFEKDYPETKIISLEQNYRSTQVILDAAYGVISHNIERKDKKLWTEQSGGQNITSYEAEDESSEAIFSAREITRLSEDGVSYDSIAVLYRTNAQSRALEEAFIRQKIPYMVVGGVRFYDRKEIKDILAYLRVLSNPRDAVSLKHIVNEPKRGIGEKTFEKWLHFSRVQNKNIVLSGMEISGSDAGIREEKARIIRTFSNQLYEITKKRASLPLSKYMEMVFRETGYEAFLLTEKTQESESRWENVGELFNVAKRYDEYDHSESLERFLEDVALVSDTDQIDGAVQAVRFMTLHSAKGLEFPYVFIVGLEEGILPHSRSYLSLSDLEEERRLMYVGMTRAKQKVYLLFARQRMIFGSTQANPPSRFLSEIPENLVEELSEEGDSMESKFSHSWLPKRYDLSLKKRNFGKPKIQKESVNIFRDGDKVIHEEFGSGIVVSQSEDIIVAVFQKHGLKKLLKSYACLKKAH